MNRLALRGFIAICLAFTVSGVVRAAAPTPAPPPTAAPAESSTEQTFVSTVTSDLQSRFATTAQATAAGYFRYTDEDQTGAISWVNIKSWQSDEQHPSQLWYDVSGRLIGADFSVLQSNSKARPDDLGRLALALARFLTRSRPLRHQDGLGRCLRRRRSKDDGENRRHG